MPDQTASRERAFVFRRLAGVGAGDAWLPFDSLGFAAADPYCRALAIAAAAAVPGAAAITVAAARRCLCRRRRERPMATPFALDVTVAAAVDVRRHWGGCDAA